MKQTTALFALMLSSAFVGPFPSFAENPPITPKSPEVYAKFAMTHEGDVVRGRLLFADEQKLGCVKCHTVDGSGTKAGPDLLTVGDKFARRDLIQAVLSPSAAIADGYGTTQVETIDGDEFVGVLKQVTDKWIELIGGDAKRIRIATADIKEQRGSSVSLMPKGLQAALTEQQFADVIEYLVSLKQSGHSLTTHHGMPENIPQLAQTIELRAFLSEELRVPRPPNPAKTATPLGLIWFGQVPGFPQRFLVVHQAGKIWMVEKNATGDRTTIFADFTAETFCARGPNGLLSLAFHPQFRDNRKYYVKHQVLEDGKITTVLDERNFAPDGMRDSGQLARRLLKIVSVAEHHSGGCVEFGPDGFLYLGMGDSAPNFDPQGYGQDLRLLLGKMLRIDVDHRDGELQYSIPRDNPFRNRSDARPEIWAYGLREPWRFSFDPLTREMWLADLGQERGDEVDIVRPGENYGWNVYEGFELFSNEHRLKDAVYVPPLFSTHRKDGQAIVGGRVYRGDKHSSFYGVYIFGDYQSKRIWGLTQTNRSLQTVRQLATCPQPITEFATDDQGHIYVVGYEGMIYQLDFTRAKFDRLTFANQ
ncbi:MAG: PQQ-dependent sugar dehydrogenase [Limisphaerales bacterium]